MKINDENCPPKVTLGDFQVLRVETRDLKNTLDSYKPQKSSKKFVNK